MFKSAIGRGQKMIVALVAVLFALAMSAQAAGYTILSADTDGVITFTPTGLVTPIITGVVACVCAAASLVVLWVGVRWLFRVIKAK